MTEAEWDTTAELAELLNCLAHNQMASERKLRLFGVACCRFNTDVFTDVRLVRALDYSEAIADGRHNERERAEIEPAVFDVFESQLDRPIADGSLPSDPFISLMRPEPYTVEAAAHCAEILEWAADVASPFAFEGIQQELHYEYCAFVRDIFQNWFRPVAFDPAWRTDTAVAVARQMYDSRNFGAMPILADALQDAGCEDEQILMHCRDATAPHVRGCWVCDLVLGFS
jgi:hypothetical protein